MVSYDLPERVIVVFHVQDPNWQFKIDLVGRQCQDETFDV